MKSFIDQVSGGNSEISGFDNNATTADAVHANGQAFASCAEDCFAGIYKGHEASQEQSR